MGLCALFRLCSLALLEFLIGGLKISQVFFVLQYWLSGSRALGGSEPDGLVEILIAFTARQP